MQITSLKSITKTTLSRSVELSTLKLYAELDVVKVQGLGYFANKKGHIPARMQHNQLLLRLLGLTDVVMARLFEATSKQLLLSHVKEMPRTTVSSVLAELFRTSLSPTERFRLVSMVLKMAEKAGLYVIREKTNGEGHHIHEVVSSMGLTKDAKEELGVRVTKAPRDYAPKEWKVGVKRDVKGGYDNTRQYSGHFLKTTNLQQPQHIWNVLNKLQAVNYMIDMDVWDKFGHHFKDSLKSKSHPAAEAKKLEIEVLKQEGKVLNFAFNFGPDNGRVYAEGYLLGLHVGLRNVLMEYADKYIATPQGIENIETMIKELEGTTKLKEKIMLYQCHRDLAKALKGEPIGLILRYDAKLSGLSMQTIATRDKEGAKYVGFLADVEDGYMALSGKIAGNVPRDTVKAGYQPYQYGAGQAATVKPMQAMGSNVDWKQWEAGFSGTFPAAFKLLKFLKEFTKYYKREDGFTFTSPSGFNCTISALASVGSVSDKAIENVGDYRLSQAKSIDTVIGRHEYIRTECHAEFMGVKPVAAFSHSLDASALHMLADGADYRITPVHDDFGTDANHGHMVQTDYVGIVQKMISMPVLKNFVNQIADSAKYTKGVDTDISSVMVNTLGPRDVVGGLFA